MSHRNGAVGIKDDGHAREVKREPEEFEETPLHIALVCYFSYLVLNLFGYLRDCMRNTGLEKNRSAVERNREVKFSDLLQFI